MPGKIINLCKIISAKFFFKRLFEKIHRDDVLEMSASLAFYSALSLAPLLILLLTFISLIHEAFREELLVQIESVMGLQASSLIREIALKVDKQPEVRDWAGLVGFLTLLFSAGAIFGNLKSSLNKIFEVTKDPHPSQGKNLLHNVWALLKEKLFNMGLVLAFVFISIVSLFISSLLSFYLRGLEALIGQLLNFLISLIVFDFLFTAIYFFLPQKRVEKKVALSSGLVTAVLFSLGKSLIGLYIGQSAVASLYGAAGSFVVLLLWVYYSSAVIFLSAEIAYVFISKTRP